jgi:outer membrane protein
VLIQMKFVKIGFLMAVIAFSGSIVSAQEVRIGFVNTDRLLRDSAPAKAAVTKLEAEFGKREKDMQEMGTRLRGQAERLERDATVLQESERQRRQRELAELDREFQRKQREFREAFTERRNEEQGLLEEKIKRSIRQVSEAEKFDLVLNDAVFVNPRIDITEKVLRALANVK